MLTDLILKVLTLTVQRADLTVKPGSFDLPGLAGRSTPERVACDSERHPDNDRGDNEQHRSFHSRISHVEVPFAQLTPSIVGVSATTQPATCADY